MPKIIVFIPFKIQGQFHFSQSFANIFPILFAISHNIPEDKKSVELFFLQLILLATRQSTNRFQRGKNQKRISQKTHKLPQITKGQENNVKIHQAQIFSKTIFSRFFLLLTTCTIFTFSPFRSIFPRFLARPTFFTGHHDVFKKLTNQFLKSMQIKFIKNQIRKLTNLIKIKEKFSKNRSAQNILKLPPMVPKKMELCSWFYLGTAKNGVLALKTQLINVDFIHYFY